MVNPAVQGYLKRFQVAFTFSGADFIAKRFSISVKMHCITHLLNVYYTLWLTFLFTVPFLLGYWRFSLPLPVFCLFLIYLWNNTPTSRRRESLWGHATPALRPKRSTIR
jgi:hypothetical protein